MHLAMSVTPAPGCLGTKKCFKNAIWRLINQVCLAQGKEKLSGDLVEGNNIPKKEISLGASKLFEVETNLKA